MVLSPPPSCCGRNASPPPLPPATTQSKTEELVGLLLNGGQVTQALRGRVVGGEEK
jgi:hypothetical protein